MKSSKRETRCTVNAGRTRMATLFPVESFNEKIQKTIHLFQQIERKETKESKKTLFFHRIMNRKCHYLQFVIKDLRKTNWEFKKGNFLPKKRSFKILDNEKRTKRNEISKRKQKRKFQILNLNEFQSNLNLNPKTCNSLKN